MLRLGTNRTHPDDGHKKPKIDVIWNITTVCPWNCKVCCVDAQWVTQRDGVASIHSHGLSHVQLLPLAQGEGNVYEQVMRQRQREGRELWLDGKMRVLDHLGDFIPKIDFSGGDPMVARENLQVMQLASRRFGREQVTLTATGAGLAKCDPQEIAPYISELNFTYDGVTIEGSENRPPGYATGNLRKARQFHDLGAAVRAECPLSDQNIDTDTLRGLYLNLHEAGIDKLLLMRLFPVGRGGNRAESIPTPNQYRWAITLMRELEARYGTPRVKVQCALKFFDNPGIRQNPCDAVSESFGLMANGTLLASPWAIDTVGQPLDDAWVLGNLATTSMTEILNTEKAKTFRRCSDQNFGQCKIFAYLHSTLKEPLARIFDDADPLYSREGTDLTIEKEDAELVHLALVGE